MTTRNDVVLYSVDERAGVVYIRGVLHTGQRSLRSSGHAGVKLRSIPLGTLFQMAHAKRLKLTPMGYFFAVPIGYTPLAHDRHTSIDTTLALTR